jgi:hypothetical protein
MRTDDPADGVMPLDWPAGRVVHGPEGMRLDRFELEELVTFAADPRLQNYVFSAERYRVLNWCTEIEERLYPPGTIANEKFMMHWIRWIGRRWTIISIPAADTYWPRKVAERLGLKLVAAAPFTVADGPMVIIAARRDLTGLSDLPGFARFPIHGPNVATIEYGDLLARQAQTPAGREVLDRERAAFGAEVMPRGPRRDTN